MPVPADWFDLVLGGTLLLAAVIALTVRDRLTAVIAFVIVGGLLALLWNVLRAPDIALAEAAIGTGVTCALFVDAVMRGRPGDRARRPPGRTTLPRRLLYGVGAALCAVITAGLATVAISAVDAGTGTGLTGNVAAAMADTPPDHEVTAVLLDFRSYDTLLEVTIVLVAAVGALALAGAGSRDPVAGASEPDLGADPAVSGVMTLLIPALLMLAGWILFAGSYETGGAFQAAAVLTGAAILGVLSGRRLRPLFGVAGRLLAVLGLAVFLVVAAVGAAAGDAWLSMDWGWAGTAIIIVEIVLTVSIGAGLTLIFLSIGRGAGVVGDAAVGRTR